MASSCPPISVVIPAQNSGQSVRDCVALVQASAVGSTCQVIAVDNQSVDGCCQGLPQDVLVIRTERELSPAAIAQLGFRVASEKTVVWLPPSAMSLDLDFAALAQRVKRNRLVIHAPRGKSRLTIIRSRLTDEPFAIERTTWSSIAPWLRFVSDRLPFVQFFSRLLGIQLLLEAICVRPGVTSANSPTHTTPRLQPSESTCGRPNSATSTFPLSVIITTHNEGAELLRTIESVRSSTRTVHEIIVVDDGSTDGSCEGLERIGVRVIRQSQRTGVAFSRRHGARIARGQTFCFLDAHQRLESGCIDRCAAVARKNKVIASPVIRDFGRWSIPIYGASFSLCKQRGYFSGTWKVLPPRKPLARSSTLRAPGYVMSRDIYERVHWSTSLRGWGGSEASISLKAFFLDVNILYVRKALARHLFRKHFHYRTDWEQVWCNHAIIARICFDERTWFDYWLPEVFDAHLTAKSRETLESDEVLAEHSEFKRRKVRPDVEFWKGILRTDVPGALRMSRLTNLARTDEEAIQCS